MSNTLTLGECKRFRRFTRRTKRGRDDKSHRFSKIDEAHVKLMCVRQDSQEKQVRKPKFVLMLFDELGLVEELHLSETVNTT